MKNIKFLQKEIDELFFKLRQIYREHEIMQLQVINIFIKLRELVTATELKNKIEKFEGEKYETVRNKASCYVRLKKYGITDEEILALGFNKLRRDINLIGEIGKIDYFRKIARLK